MNIFKSLYERYTGPSKHQINMITEFKAEFESKVPDEETAELLTVILIYCDVLLRTKSKEEFRGCYEQKLLPVVGKYYGITAKRKPRKRLGDE